ncbi:MAG: hypothetical protein ACHREM_14905 [Polyangiales bacterium]
MNDTIMFDKYRWSERAAGPKVIAVPAKSRWREGARMELSVRRRALDAAAKVTITASMLGCGGMVATTEGAAPSDQDATSSTTTTVDQVSVTCGADAAPSYVPTYERTIACCEGLATETDAGGWQLPDAATGDPQVLACCTAFLQHLDQVPTDSAKFQPVRGVCCSATHDYSNVACTPWGPPMPPEMPREVA